MGTDVAAFAKQLKEDGIDAAKQEAEKILTDAKAKADKMIADAKIEIEKAKKESETGIAQNRQRSEAEMKLVARDLMNGLRKKVEEVGATLLKGKVAEALNDKEIVKNAISELLKAQESDQNWELALGQKVAKPLADVVANIFKENNASVKLVEELKKSGFEIRLESGNEVIEVTEESVTESFKKLLSPELKKILEA